MCGGVLRVHAADDLMLDGGTWEFAESADRRSIVSITPPATPMVQQVVEYLERKPVPIVRGYSKWFGVDLLCAIAELRLLGVTVARDYESRVRRTVDNLAAYRQRKKLERASVDSPESTMDCDGIFAYITGYTSGGMPFGVTWEELDQKPPWEQ